MPLITRLSKKKEAMEPYPISSSSSAPLDLVTPISIHNPPPSTPKKLGPSPQDIEAFMNHPRNATLVNAIMENFQKDKIEEPTFENPTLLSDPSHPLFGKLPPPIGPDDPNHLLYIPHEENKPTIFDVMDPNIPLIQLGARIPSYLQDTIT